MNIDIREPKHPILKKYIEYYYQTPISNYTYFAYPHYNLPVSIVSKTNVSIEDNEVVIRQDSQSKLQSFTVHKFIKPLKVIIEGTISDFCIVFKPYGVAQFLSQPINLNHKKEVSVIRLFENLNTYIATTINPPIEDRIDQIENYLLSKFQEKEGTEIIINAIHLLKTIDEISIKEVASRCNCHEKKLYRLFKTICGDTPMTFKKIIQFRNALEKIKEQNPAFNLTKIALDANYYDQAAFNNAFKKLTKETPGKFFKNVNKHSEKNIYFKENV